MTTSLMMPVVNTVHEKWSKRVFCLEVSLFYEQRKKDKEIDRHGDRERERQTDREKEAEREYHFEKKKRSSL